MRTKPCLMSVDVQRMVAACKAEADKNNWKLTICVVDDSGGMLYLERMDGAGPMSVEVVLGKARTAAMTRRPSNTLAERVKEAPGAMNIPNILPMRGGVPLIYEGECVGAIAASGAQGFEDEIVSLAGAAALG